MTPYWRNDAPPCGIWCEVWFWTQVLPARFDGAHWRDEAGLMLAGVEYWRVTS
jgi:hypothetical protein